MSRHLGDSAQHKADRTGYRGAIDNSARRTLGSLRLSSRRRDADGGRRGAAGALTTHDSRHTHETVARVATIGDITRHLHDDLRTLATALSTPPTTPDAARGPASGARGRSGGRPLNPEEASTLQNSISNLANTSELLIPTRSSRHRTGRDRSAFLGRASYLPCLPTPLELAPGGISPRRHFCQGLEPLPRLYEVLPLLGRAPRPCLYSRRVAPLPVWTVASTWRTGLSMITSVSRLVAARSRLVCAFAVLSPRSST